MKIKFIKDYAINRGACPLNIGGFDMLETEIVKADTVVDLEKDNGDGAFSDELIKWLIDNGFAEKVDDEWPQVGDAFWSISSDAISYEHDWHNYAEDRRKKAIGNVFKTKKAAGRLIDYLKAITVVRQDEGVIDLQGVREEYETEDNKYNDFSVYTIAYNIHLRKLVVTDSDDYISANAIWFDSKDFAQASLDNHPDEWTIIANYDWSRE